MAPHPRREEHPYYMHDSIVQQPDAIARVINEEASTINSLVKETLVNAKDIHIVGIGTSWHATLVGEGFLRAVAGRNDARAWNSFEFSSFPPELTAQSVVIVLSHRGTKQFSLKSLELSKAAGAKTVIITGLSSNAQTELCNYVIRTSVQEKSSAFTISHTCAMTALLLIAIGLGETRNVPLAAKLRSEIASLPNLVRDALGRESDVQAVVAKTHHKSIFYFVGYGINVPSTYETALKIKEACYVTTEGFQIEQYVHGPFCATDERCAVVFLDPLRNAEHPGPARTLEIINAALGTGATVSSITASEKQLDNDNYSQVILPPIEESFTPIVYLVLLQYRLALARGKNPDTFRQDNPVFAAVISKLKL